MVSRPSLVRVVGEAVSVFQGLAEKVVHSCVFGDGPHLQRCVGGGRQLDVERGDRGLGRLEGFGNTGPLAGRHLAAVAAGLVCGGGLAVLTHFSISWIWAATWANSPRSVGRVPMACR